MIDSGLVLKQLCVVSCRVYWRHRMCTLCRFRWAACIQMGAERRGTPMKQCR
jgi:hypothetical protein